MVTMVLIGAIIEWSELRANRAHNLLVMSSGSNMVLNGVSRIGILKGMP